MQVQNVTPQHSQPNFQARNLSRVVSTAKDGAKSVIDVYSINKADKNFIERFINILKGHELPQDTLAISGTDRKLSVLEALKKALHINKDSGSGVLVAIEDSKNIAGIAEYNTAGDMYIDTLYMFKNDKHNMGRKSLLLQALKDIRKQKDFSADINASKLNEKSREYYSNLGFNKDTVFKTDDLTISFENLDRKIDRLENRSKINVKNFERSKNVDLTEVLNLD